VRMEQTRSAQQVRSHAQKHFMRMSKDKALQREEEEEEQGEEEEEEEGGKARSVGGGKSKIAAHCSFDDKDAAREQGRDAGRPLV
jgi:hypothetical protein